MALAEVVASWHFCEALVVDQCGRAGVDGVGIRHLDSVDSDFLFDSFDWQLARNHHHCFPAVDQWTGGNSGWTAVDHLGANSQLGVNYAGVDARRR